MIAVTAGFVLLGALLIDFSRIAAFRHASLLAVQSGVRSVLSSYDPDFYQRYGLFIRGGDTGDELFRTALDGYFVERKDRFFNYWEAEWLNAGVMESRPLADHDVFRRQVLEEMKYKAPVNLALELGERFRGIAPDLEEAAATVDLLERMQRAYDRREAELDRVLAAQIKWGQVVLASFQKLMPELRQVASQYSSYLSQRQALAQIGPEADPLALQALFMAISAYESRVSRLTTDLSAGNRKVAAEAARLASEAAEALDRARAINGEIRAMAEEASADAAGSESLSEIRETVWQLVLDESFFTDYREELKEQDGRCRELGQEAEQTASLFASLGSADENSLSRAAASLQESVNRFLAAYGENGGVIGERRAKLQEHRAHESERKALEKQAQEEWAGWKGLSGSIRKEQGTAEEKEDFQKVRSLARENLKWNEELELPAEQTDLEDPATGRDSAMKQTNRLLGGLEDALIGKRDDLYFSEYAHVRFSRFSPADVKKLISGEKISLSLDYQETEFILYGFAHPAGNIAAAYSEIFAFRLAVRTLEGLIESRSTGHPLLILAAALVYGVKHAIQDIYTLLDKDFVPLSKYLNVETTYADYLRLFYLLHGSTPDRLSRFIAVMEHQTGLALSRAYTYVGGEGTASMRLWFFPGLLKVMGRTGHLGGTVKGNRYEGEFTAESSYQ